MKLEKENSSKEVQDQGTDPSSSGEKPQRSTLWRRKWKIIFITPSIKKELVPLKIVLFCWYGAFSSLLPYLTIYLKQLGITASETAFIYTFFPVAKLLGPAIGGLIADKLGRYKPVLYVAFLFNIIFATCFLFIPSIPESKCQIPIHLTCKNLQSPSITLDKCCRQNLCQFLNQSAILDIEFCNLKCLGSNVTTNFEGTICFQDIETRFCINTKENNSSKIETIPDKLKASFNPESENRSCSYKMNKLEKNNQTLLMPSCFIGNVSEGCHVFCAIKNSEIKESCESRWSDRFPTLAITFVVFMSFQVFVATCFSLVEASTLAMVKEHKDNYGRQRVWAILATAVFSPVTGFLVDVASSYKGKTDYSPSFYIFDILMITNIVLIYILDLPVAPPAKNIVKNMKSLIVMPEVVTFLIVIFFLGTFWGFLESFLFWHLLDLGSPKYLLGLTLTVGAIVGLPFLYTSEFFVRKFGRVNLLIVAFLFYFFRCLGYSYIYNPWWFVLFEAMEASTYHLMWVAAATYAASLAPKGLLATIQGCVSGMHFGIGRGSGSLIGGNLISAFGNRIAFRYMGISSILLGTMYAIIYYAILRNLKNKTNENDNTVPEGKSPESKVSTTEEKL